MSSSNDIVLKVENLSKVYRLGEVGTGTISHDLNRWFARIRGKEDPFSKVGSVNDRTATAQKDEYVKALSNINFEVKRGEVLGIIGKNGAGKSTLLKVISQITAPTTGSIKAKGRIASLLEVGTGMHPEMTGRENVYLNGTILGMTRREIDNKFEEIMDFAGCTKYADTPVKRYSSGMKVRLGFAVAAFLEPEILIVDEVLAVGDAEFQKKAIGKMQDISAGGGRTVLFVSHNMGSIEAICGRCMVLEDGSIGSIRVTNEAIEFYLNQVNRKMNTEIFKRTDRIGSNSVLFSKVEFFADGKRVKSLSTGKNTIIRLHYKIMSIKRHLDKCRISVAIQKDERPFILLSSDLITHENITLINDGYIDFIISKLPLSNGYYNLTLYLESNSETQDLIYNACGVDVTDGLYFETGKNYPKGWGGKTVLIDHQISLHQ